jgi:Family of unknown function (DUF6328)
MGDAKDAATDRGGGSGETPAERVNRELIELLNELRVALPGVQVLFAFLLAVPFATGFERTTGFQRDLFFAILLATAISSALLIAPSAYHRINFRARDKEQMLLTSNGLAIAGLVFLALAIVGAIVLIADFIFGSDVVPIISAVVGLATFAVAWFILPIVRRSPQQTPE